MSRKLRKAMMKRSQLESKYYKSKTLMEHLNYKKQKNYVGRLYKSEWTRVFKNLDLKSYFDNENF